jgi:hypothetical protein
MFIGGDHFCRFVVNIPYRPPPKVRGKARKREMGVSQPRITFRFSFLFVVSCEPITDHFPHNIVITDDDDDD